MKKGWIIFISIAVVIIAVIAIVGGKMYMNNKKLNEDMSEVVQSEEAKNIFEKGLKNLDPKALTSDGVIKSYKIDYDSIERNPMGGIMVKLLINNNNELYVKVTLNKNSENNALEESGGGISSQLSTNLGR
ncbi:DUF1310 family protein [Listeria kieliensis]